MEELAKMGNYLGIYQKTYKTSKKYVCFGNISKIRFFETGWLSGSFSFEWL